MTPNLIKLEKLVKSRKPILLNNKLITRILAFEDMRDFTEAIRNWGYNRDFTYESYRTTDWQRFLRLWIKEVYLES